MEFRTTLSEVRNNTVILEKKREKKRKEQSLEKPNDLGPLDFYNS
jgi:hypothetical protein